MIAVIDCRMPKEARDSLTRLGFSVIPLPPFSALSAPVASHPDMLLFPLGNRIFVHKAYYQETRQAIERIANESEKELFLVDVPVSSDYPYDIALNLFTVGKILFGRTDHIPNEIAEYANEMSYQLIHTRQGYAKCATVTLGERGIISADPSILQSAQKAGIDALKISQGNVLLPGYEYGFLGGASGHWDHGIFFCGDISAHPDFININRFCHNRGFHVTSLSRTPLLDVGTILFL